MRRALALLAAAVALAGCGDRDDGASKPLAPAKATVEPSTEVSTAASKPSPSADDVAVRAAADAVLAAIDVYDANRFARLAVEPKDQAFRPLDAKEVDATVTDLHQKYGVRPRTVRVEPGAAYALGVAGVTVVFGDHEDAISLTFTRIDGDWKLSAIGSADAGTPDAPPVDALPPGHPSPR